MQSHGRARYLLVAGRERRPGRLHQCGSELRRGAMAVAAIVPGPARARRWRTGREPGAFQVVRPRHHSNHTGAVMTGVSKILAAVLLAAGVILAALAYYLARQPAPAPATPQATAAPAPEQPAAPRATYPVVLAAKDIQAGTRLDIGMLKVQQWPIPLAHGYAKPEELAGQVARLDIAGGEPITNQSLAQGLAQQLRDGERAVAVPVDEIVGAGNRITPGDLVDVFFALEKDNEVKGSQVRLLQSRVRVLAYGAQSIDG